MLIVMLALVLGAVWAGYFYGKKECEQEIQELKKQPVNVKYVRANFVPVVVERSISPGELCLAEFPGDIERALVKNLQRELGEAIWEYATIEQNRNPADPLYNTTKYRATVYVRPRQAGGRL